MGFIEWAGYASGILALIGIGFALSRAYERFIERPQMVALRLAEPATILPALNTLWTQPDLNRLEIVGYSVHSLYDPINPLVAYAIRQGLPVRILMLDPESQFLAERARSEAARTSLPIGAFLARSQHSIHRTAERILEHAETVKYQNNLKEANCTVRVYSAPPIYRGVLSNLGSASSSYLENLEMPSRDFRLTDPRVKDPWNEREAVRAENWTAYLTKFRSRPYLLEAVLIDLYDTLIDVNAVDQRAHQKLLAREAGLPLGEFLQEWELTRIRSNAGQFTSTRQRFEAILGSRGLPKERSERLADLENSHVRSSFKLAPEARSFLLNLSSRGYRTAVVSNCSTSAMEAIASTGLHNLVDAFSLSFQTGSLKPDPSIYNDALAKLGVSADRAVFIGDGTNDELDGARSLGIRTIQAGWYARRQVAGHFSSASTFLGAARLLDPEAEWSLG